MKMLISVCFFFIISFLFSGCYTIIIIPPDEDIICDIDQPLISDPPAPPHPDGPPPIPHPTPHPTPHLPPVTYPPVVIVTQPETAEPVKQDHREIYLGRGPANQNPATPPSVDQRESHSGRNPVVSNPPSQTYSEQSGSRNDGRENTYRPERDADLKRNTH